MHTYDCIFWAGPLDISDILSVQYKIKSKKKIPMRAHVTTHETVFVLVTEIYVFRI